MPLPELCRNLNWPTSDPFRIRWIAKTPVKFRYVGHLKNTLNRDEKGDARAVLVGKDGQEISVDAGAGVCRILEDVDRQEAIDMPGQGEY